MSLTLYRRSVLGETLSQTLNELKAENKITDNIEKKTLELFDRLMCEEISKRHKNKCTIKGKVISFKNCDDIWIFYGKEVSMKTDSQYYTSTSLKIVACDVKMKDNITQSQKSQEMYYNQDENN
mgnify:CR=1 FL=1